MSDISFFANVLGKDAEYVLNFNQPKIPREAISVPGHGMLKKIFSLSDRPARVVKNLVRMEQSGRLAGTGYVSILPVDQSIEHSAGSAFAKNPIYFDPENIIKLAVEGGCSAIATTVGVLGLNSKKYADKIPFIVKLNHNDLLRFPNDFDQIMFASVEQAYNLGAAGVGATIYFGSPESKRQIQEVRQAFYEAHQKGMFTVAWCYLRNPGFSKNGKDYETAADLTGQAVHLAATLGADIVKQKLPTLNGGYKAVSTAKKPFGKYDEKMYNELASDHPIDLCRYQVLNAYAGKIGLISSGGASGNNDLHDAVYAAVVNKRAGGMGMIAGRKAFQKPMKEGVKLLHAVQDVYISKDITVA